ncbi:MAG TPA: MlaD family protein [Solirubrobacteraceae bacterium]|jgi:ABC-type transporter Mla subunit MlaD|nr:MlaD family protein [Solirubrobacteraceae bacterium]
MTAKSRRKVGDHRLRTGIILLVVALIAFYFSLTKQVPFIGQSGTVLRAEFTEPNQLSGHSAGSTPVRVDGVDVGHVTSIKLTDGGRAGIVTMRITNHSVQLHSDATATEKFRTLLGADFAIALNPGSSSAPPLGGNFIGLSHTTVQVELDDVLRAFSGNTPAATRTDLAQLSSLLNGPQTGTLIDTVPPTLAPTATAFRAVQGTDPGDLAGLVQSASRTTRSLGRYQASLESLISGAQETLDATAAETVPLAETFRDAPAALDATETVAQSVEQTLPSLNTLIDALQPGARELAPAASAARPAVLGLRTTLDRAQPVLRLLQPAISELAAASPPGQTLMSELAPTVTRLQSQLIPYLQTPDSDLKIPLIDLIGPTFSGLASIASEYDNHAHVLHFPAQPSANSLTLVPCTVFVGAPTPSELLQCNSLNSLLGTLLGGSS